jgi:hypothetical protein
VARYERKDLRPGLWSGLFLFVGVCFRLGAFLLLPLILSPKKQKLTDSLACACLDGRRASRSAASAFRAPLWHCLDVTPEGGGNWYTSLEYGTKVLAAG